jgi:hypothetical protein
MARGDENRVADHELFALVVEVLTNHAAGFHRRIMLPTRQFLS